MQIPILVEPIAGNGYRARGAEPFSLTGEGATPEAAVARLKEQLQARLRQGAVAVEVGVKTTRATMRRTPAATAWKTALRSAQMVKP